MYRKRRSDIFLLDRVKKGSFIKVQILLFVMIIRALLTLTRSSLQEFLTVSYSSIAIFRDIKRN